MNNNNNSNSNNQNNKQLIGDEGCGGDAGAMKKKKEKEEEEKSDDILDSSFVLNILDGTLETPGRIIILTSNYPEKLISVNPTGSYWFDIGVQEGEPSDHSWDVRVLPGVQTGWDGAS